MIESQNIRQILAIMVTDIVDYTETMNNDEQKAWEYLKKQRTLIPPMISKMNGHMFKEMGDGTFSKFKSAIDAVQCAVKIQEEAINNELPIRIAVHLGDVMDDGVDVIGTGVNIASRINSLAETGNIVISEDVWRQIRNQGDMDATSLGQKDIKGFHQTVEVFELTYNPDGSITKKVKVTETVTITDEEGKEVQAESAKKEFIKKVAIFPFDFAGDDDSLEYLKYGIPFGCCVSLLQDPLVEIEFPNEFELDGESFINKLRNAGYERGENVPLPLKKKIARELHCDYFIFGNIKINEANIEINPKVYSSENGKLLYENKVSDSDNFILIDDLSIDFKKNMGIPDVHLEKVENLPLSEILTESKDAFRCFIEGIRQRQYNFDFEGAFKLLKDSTAMDPTFSLSNYSLFWTGFLSNIEEYQELANNAINNAISHIYKLPPRLAFLIKLYNFLISRGDPEKAEKVVKMWVRQFPESLTPYQRLAGLYARAGKREDAIKVYEDILIKFPEDYNSFLKTSNLYKQMGNYESALENAEKYMKHCPTEAISFNTIADIYYEKGDLQNAKDYFEQALMIDSNNVNYMINISSTEKGLGNFIECEGQLEEALSYCKNNQDYNQVYGAQSRYFTTRGKVNESIKNKIKSIDYLQKYMNPIDTELNKIFYLSDYVTITQTDTAITKLREAESKVMYPFNLLSGVGEIFIGGESEDVGLIESGVEKVKKFLKEKDFPWLRGVPNLGTACLLMLKNKDFDGAISMLEESMIFYTEMKHDLTRSIIQCYYRKKDFEPAIKAGVEWFKHSPNSPLIILETAKAYKENNEIDKAKECISKLLGIWEDADEEYIYFQEANKLWKKLNTVKETA